LTFPRSTDHSVDPPDDPKEYIHRVSEPHVEPLDLDEHYSDPEETGFLRYLKAAKVALNE
jgi:ATP-dependent RNA helicase DDX18/HAS1